MDNREILIQEVYMKRLRKASLFIITLLLFLSTQACGMKYNIKGRVVDSETGKPIEGAAITTLWYHYQLMPRLTGLASGYETIATYDTLTDSDGYFETTKHLSVVYDIGVYKKEYVGWCDNYIFNPEGEKMKRDDFDLGNNMVIKLEPFKKHYSKFDHAKFVVEYVDNNSNGPTFNNAIRNEIIIVFRKKK